MEYCAARLIDTLECFFPEAVRSYLRSKMRSRSTSRLRSTYAYFLCVNRLACSSRMAPKPSHNGSGEAEKRCHPPGGKVSPSGCWYPAKRFASRVDPRTGTEASPRTRARFGVHWNGALGRNFVSLVTNKSRFVHRYPQVFVQGRDGRP
jgi:hypothetical protein